MYVCVLHTRAPACMCAPRTYSQKDFWKRQKESMWGGWMQKSNAKFPSWRILEKPVKLTHGRTRSTCQGTQYQITMVPMGFPGGSSGKESACNAGDLGSIPGLRRPLGEGMATPSSIPAWRIPWTEESGGLQSMGLQRVGHD